jgi:Bacterial sugar transferase
MALILLSPVLAVLSLAVLVSVGRPILFRQTRIGRDGRSFDMLKFRSMKPDTAQPRNLRMVAATDDVLGPGGAFLRRSSMDELPQLLNVLKGDMSLVGPRPERPEFASEFQQTVYRYGDRHRVKSGITGWAQVHGLRGKTSLADRPSGTTSISRTSVRLRPSSRRLAPEEEPEAPFRRRLLRLRLGDRFRLRLELWLRHDGDGLGHRLWLRFGSRLRYRGEWRRLGLGWCGGTLEDRGVPRACALEVASDRLTHRILVTLFPHP